MNLGQGTSNMAEAQALLYGFKWGVSRDYNRVWVKQTLYYSTTASRENGNPLGDWTL